ncbi:LacI family DNA-binding transcriptional regulator [Streptomyces sp. TRM64462]|uniref:LacI family DNA-binding transcriptional regulator n=1 Tax=Streptomyces sp. TRM64462 TaxID=2741726 RepID=UPI0020C76CD5|nr:LacI family DNA-binding transcriptional regulator [Streptomyces sp. TRM64462]
MAANSVTSADVARLAGVSRATVSFVLNNTQTHRVSEATRTRVREAAQQLGYVPHAAARSLRAGHSNLVLIPASVSAIGHLVSTWLDALHGELEERGYTAVLHAGRYADAATGARAWAELRPAAVLALDGDRLTAQAVQVLHRAGVGTVLALAARPLEGVRTLRFDHARIGEIAAEHLVVRGRRRIGVVMPRERGLEVFARPRLEGARAVASRSTATVTEVPMAYTHASASDVAAAWGDLGLDSVFAYNDEYAALLLHALQSVGIRVPGDVAVVGADDLVTSALQHPPLTTVRLDLVPPSLVADIIDGQINGTDTPDAPAIEVVLVPRASS